VSGANRPRMVRAFSRAEDYDARAIVQREVAVSLAAQIAGIDLPEHPRILEIGCGTGFLTQALAEKGIAGDWLVTDISPAMVRRSRARMDSYPQVRFAVLDGEHETPEAAGSYDLVCSSLALQWFDDPQGAAARMLGWLAPGGHLLFTTLASGTFAEWRAAHEAEGLVPGLRVFPQADAWAQVAREAQAGPPRIDRLAEHHADAMAFLRSLKAIGAATPQPGHAPLAPAALRRVMRRFEREGTAVSYEVVTCHYRRP
jgi:malonyl-CoA O-methyltransferase